MYINMCVCVCVCVCVCDDFKVPDTPNSSNVLNFFLFIFWIRKGYDIEHVLYKAHDILPFVKFIPELGIEE